MECGSDRCASIHAETKREVKMADAKDLLPLLAEKLHAARNAEEEARSNRITIEAQVAVLIPTEGTKQTSVTLSNGYKITVKRPISYKADIAGIQKVLKGTDLPVPIESKTTLKLDVKGYEWYRDHKPGAFARLAEHVVICPLKTSVELKPPVIK